MLTHIAIGAAAYIVALVLFLAGWKRHFDHIHALDAAERRIRHEQRHEPTWQDDLSASELSVPHSPSIATKA